MSDFVTVVLRMHPDDADGLRDCLGAMEFLSYPPKVSLRGVTPSGTPSSLGFVATVHRVGTLPVPECAYDTNGDGDCVNPDCPKCGPNIRAGGRGHASGS